MICTMRLAPVSRRAVGLQQNFWPREFWRGLTVGFMGGSVELHDAVRRYAVEWCQDTGIEFKFLGSWEDARNATIRVAFSPGQGSWSYVGTDALLVPKDEPTMNLGWLDRADEVQRRRAVLHEFGHGLGLIHEHQGPDAGIQWDRARAYAFYSGPPNFWSAERVDLNLFQRYSRELVNGSKFDEDSIMLYPFPQELTKGMDISKENVVLSEGDRLLIRRVYPAWGQSGKVEGGRLR